MIFSYYLHQLNYPSLTYKYIIHIYNEILELDIDLNQYKNYIYIKNVELTEKKYYKVIKILNKKKNINNKTIGDVELINVSKYVKNRQYTKNVIKNGLLFEKCSQTHFDKYFFILNINNDNSKLFKYIYSQIILLYKEKFLQKQKNTIKNNTIKFQINNKTYSETLI